MNEQEYNKLYLGEPSAGILMELLEIARERKEGFSARVIHGALHVAKTEREGVVAVFESLIYHIKDLDDALRKRESHRVIPQSVIMRKNNTP